MARTLGFILSGVFVFFVFQNCGEMIAHKQLSSAPTTQGGEDVDLEAIDCEIVDCNSLITKSSQACFLNGVAVAEGEAIQAFQSPSGAECKSEMRTCSKKQLDGAFQYTRCNTDTQVATRSQNCLFNGQVLADGELVETFLQSSVAADAECQSQYRRCQNGVLTGSYRYSSCEKGAKKACLFNGITVAHKNFVKAFSKSESGACQEEYRVCQDGELSGSYQNASCSDDAKTCKFNGQTLLEAETVKAYTEFNESTRRCLEEERVCTDGQLSGSYTFPNCLRNESNKRCEFGGEVIAHGEIVAAFKRVDGAPCEKTQRQCNNGALEGDAAFNLAVCEANQPKSCEAFGKVVPHGETVKSFLVASESAYGACEEGAIVSKCQDGSFDKPLQAFSTCERQSKPQKDCIVNGEVLKGGRSVSYYAQNSVNLDNKNDGCGGDNYIRLACVDGAIFDKTDILEDDKLLAFDKFDSQTHTHKTCEVVGKDCSFRGINYKTGDRATFYKRDKVDFSESWSCAVSGFDNHKNARCWNGKMVQGFDPVDLSAYPYRSCEVITEDCTYKGETVEHGRNLGELFKKDKVPSTDYDRGGRDISCESNGNHVEIRCIDGKISNRRSRYVDGKSVYDPVNTALYPHETCEVEAASCVLEGQTVAHEQRFRRYKNDLAPYVPGGGLNSCTSEGNSARGVCQNGNLKTYGDTDDEGNPIFADFDFVEYPHKTCRIDAKSCVFDVYTYPHGSIINSSGTKEVVVDGETQTLRRRGSGFIYKIQSAPFDLESNECAKAENRIEARCVDGVITRDGLPVDTDVFKYSSCVTETVGCTVNGVMRRHFESFNIYKQPRVYADQGTSCLRDDFGHRVRCLDGKVYKDERPYVELDPANYPYNSCARNTGNAP